MDQYGGWEIPLCYGMTLKGTIDSSIPVVPCHYDNSGNDKRFSRQKGYQSIRNNKRLTENNRSAFLPSSGDPVLSGSLGSIILPWLCGYVWSEQLFLRTSSSKINPERQPDNFLLLGPVVQDSQGESLPWTYRYSNLLWDNYPSVPPSLVVGAVDFIVSIEQANVPQKSEK